MPDKFIILSFVIYCAISLFNVSGDSSAHIVVHVNNDLISDGAKNVNYKVGDIINFSCSGPDMNNFKHYGVVYEKDGTRFKIPKDGGYEINTFIYSIQTYDFDDKSIVQCEVEIWNEMIKEYEFIGRSTSVTLVMLSDNSLNDTIPEVHYSESNPVTHICSEQDSLFVMMNGTQQYYIKRKLYLAPSYTGSVVFCSKIERKEDDTNRAISYQRIIYNQRKYIYTAKVLSETSSLQGSISTTQIGMVVGAIIIVCIVLLGGFVLHRNKRNRPNVTPSPHQDTNNDKCSTELIYAELALSQTPRSGCSKYPTTEETPYAEISRCIGKRMPQVIEESPYAEIIARKY
ncbi:hypothetical protein O3G_MSEX003119 [Manduca sexta]|uniref:Uncharacterized protein n=2 Tax=Manduca sexta TaxID=7130 RepID=A0A921YR06_MANSE|nr:hypothetical protein O3G_MSEX003119 [Manduca sexta]